VPTDLTPYRDALGNAVNQLATLPQRAFEAPDPMRSQANICPNRPRMLRFRKHEGDVKIFLSSQRGGD
jgi:hypothetical protein